MYNIIISCVIVKDNLHVYGTVAPHGYLWNVGRLRLRLPAYLQSRVSHACHPVLTILALYYSPSLFILYHCHIISFHFMTPDLPAVWWVLVVASFELRASGPGPARLVPRSGILCFPI